MIKPIVKSVTKDAAITVARSSIGGVSWSSYWSHRNEVLFFANDTTDILNKVVGGQLPNQKSGATDFLTVTGVGLNARYRTPDTAAYKSADTDYCFWKTDATESTCDGNRLIAYDFTRTIIKYSNTSPYVITAIMILSSDVDTNKMRDDFDLSIWWSNVLSDHGNTKENRSAERSVWTAESVYETESDALFTRMTALGEEPTDERKTLINDAIIALKAAGLFDTKFDAFGLTRAHAEGSAKLNWIKDDHNLVKAGAGTLTFTADVGFHSDGSTTYLKTDFVPSADGEHFLLDDASFGIKVSGTIDETSAGHGARGDAATKTTAIFNIDAVNGGYHYLNGNNVGAYNPKRVSGYNAVARMGATEFKFYANANTTTIGQHDGAVTNKELTLLAFNDNDSIGNFCAATEYVEFWFAGAYITQAEFLTLQGIINTYIAGL